MINKKKMIVTALRLALLLQKIHWMLIFLSVSFTDVISYVPSPEIPQVPCVSASSGLLDSTVSSESFSVSEAEASLLCNKPSDVDYSDLASFLTESFDTRQVP